MQQVGAVGRSLVHESVITISLCPIDGTRYLSYIGDMETFLATLSPMHAAKAKSALEMQVRLNGGEILPRYRIIEQRVAAGATIGSFHGEPILQRPDGAFLDKRNITLTGLDYARFLLNR